MKSGEKVLWSEPRVLDVGDVAEIVQEGEGKLTAPASDPGESRKVQPDE